MTADMMGLLFVGTLIFTAVCIIASSRLPLQTKRILIAAVLLRVVTSVLYYRIVLRPGGAIGADAGIYYRQGLVYAEFFSRFDFSPITNPDLWDHNRWWGTQFVYYPTGLVMSIVGSNPLALFLVFSFFGLVGVACFGLVFHRAYPHVSTSRYLGWLLLFPSVAFWTSAIGKEALMMLGFGMASLGLLARKGSPNWILAVSGLSLVFCIRPQVAAVVVLALILAETFSKHYRWTLFGLIRLVIVIGAGVLTINLAMQQIGAEGADDLGGVQGYLESEATTAVEGGSTVGERAPGITGAPVGLFNILFRPFVWEVRSATQLVAALEVVGLWLLVIRRRRWFWSSLKGWRSDTSIAFAVVFATVYATTFGMVVLNLGVLVRQRIYIFPCILLMLFAEPGARRAIREFAGAPRRLPRPTVAIQGYGEHGLRHRGASTERS